MAHPARFFARPRYVVALVVVVLGLGSALTLRHVLEERNRGWTQQQAQLIQIAKHLNTPDGLIEVPTLDGTVCGPRLAASALRCWQSRQSPRAALMALKRSVIAAGLSPGSVTCSANLLAPARLDKGESSCVFQSDAGGWSMMIAASAHRAASTLVTAAVVI